MRGRDPHPREDLSTSGLQTAGSIGFSSYLSSSANNARVTLMVDELTATAPGPELEYVPDIDRAVRTFRWTLALLVGAALGAVPIGLPTADATVSLGRTDIFLAAAPESVAIGDLDGQHGKDIVVALPSTGSVGVLLNNGDGTFATMQPYSAGPSCAGLAVDITLGDVTTPAPGNRLLPDGHLDAYVACTPYVVRLTGDGSGALGNPEPINLGVAQYLGSGTLDLLALMRRPDGNPAPLLVFQRNPGVGRHLCIGYNLDPGEDLVCDDTPVQGPLAVGDLNGSAAGVPPDEVVTSEGGAVMGIFGFAPPVPPSTPMTWGDSTRNVPGDPAGPPASSRPRWGTSTTMVTSTCSPVSTSTA